MAGATASPRLLITGFGHFPGAPDNPTSPLVRALAAAGPAAYGAAQLRIAVLPTDYRRSWPVLRRLYAGFQPDVVVHFGLSRSARCIRVETRACRRVDPGKPDAAGYAPKRGLGRQSEPDEVASTLPASAVVAALRAGGFAAERSSDAGDYVCNATLYRSLSAARGGQKIGFIHVPSIGPDWPLTRLCDAGSIVVGVSCESWGDAG